MALNLSKNKIDKLIALLDSSDESSDLGDDSYLEDEEDNLSNIKVKEEDDDDDGDDDDDDDNDDDDDTRTKIELNINEDLEEMLGNDVHEPISGDIKMVKLEYKPIEVEDSSAESEDDDISTVAEDDPNDPLNIKIGDKELNLDLLYPEQETKEPENTTANNIHKKKSPPVPFKKKKSRIPLEKRVRCPVCKAQRKNEEYLDLHMQTHEGKSEFECNVCGKFFSTTASVVRHQSLHEAAYKHQCEKCGKRFIFSSSLYSHKARHDDSRPFSCTVCGQTFKATKHLKRHMFIHTGERPFVCSVCGKAYSMKYMLKSHFKVHTRERHVCKICEKSFKRKNDFEKHMEWHVTGITNKRNAQKPRKPRKKKIEMNVTTAPPQNDHIFVNNVNSLDGPATTANDITPMINPSIPPSLPFQMPLFNRFNNNVNT